MIAVPAMWTGPRQSAKTIARGAFAEFLAMTLFVFFGCGAAARNVLQSRCPGKQVQHWQDNAPRCCACRDGDGVNTGEMLWEPASVLIIALQFGLGITVLAWGTVHYGGGHINCAVTFAMVLVGKCHPVTGVFYFMAQLCGSILGAAFLQAAVSANNDALDYSGALGANGLQTSFVTNSAAFLVETLGTFLLVITVLTTAVDEDNVTSTVKNF
eukprot:2748248-Pleurochrysis_carterae.AAC.1